MITILIATIIIVNLGGLVLLYLQHRQAAREREACARMAVEIYNAANGAILKCAELVELATAAHAQLEQDRLEYLRLMTALRIAEDVRGGARDR